MTTRPIAVAIAAALAAAVLVSGCTQLQQAASTVCTQVQQYESDPAVSGPLDAQDPHSAVGVLWADTKSACANGAPAAGVSTNWGEIVLSELLPVAERAIPALIGLL